MAQKQFDPTLKRLTEDHPAEWVEFLAQQVGLPRSPQVEVINAEVSTVTAASDKVIRVGGRQSYLLHVEFVSSHKARLEQTTLLYNVLLGDRQGLPVRSVIVLLRPEADRSRFTGAFRRDHPEGRTYHEFHYDVVRLWQVSPQVLLEGGLGLLPLAPLGEVTQAELPEVIRRMNRRLRTEATTEQAKDLWAATFLLLGLNHDTAFVEALFQGVQEMEDSVTYQAILAKGEAHGRTEEARKILLNLGRKRLGDPDAATLTSLQAISDPTQIEGLIDRLDAAASWTDLVPPSRKRKKRP